MLYFCLEGGAALSVPSAICTCRAVSAWKQATGYLLSRVSQLSDGRGDLCMWLVPVMPLSTP